MRGATPAEAVAGCGRSRPGRPASTTKRCPSSATVRSTSSSSSARRPSSWGRKKTPTPYGRLGQPLDLRARRTHAGSAGESRRRRPSRRRRRRRRGARGSRARGAPRGPSRARPCRRAARRTRRRRRRARRTGRRGRRCRLAAFTQEFLASRTGRASPPWLLVGGGGEEGRLARTRDARDERDGNRLLGVRRAQHRGSKTGGRRPASTVLGFTRSLPKKRQKPAGHPVPRASSPCRPRVERGVGLDQCAGWGGCWQAPS